LRDEIEKYKKKKKDKRKRKVGWSDFVGKNGKNGKTW
jgi:hypothetical protein